MRATFVALCVAYVALSTAPARADRRVAFVVGNGARPAVSSIIDQSA